MTQPLFEKHRTVLDTAIQALRERGYWTPYPEMPSPKIYGETAEADGKAAVEARFGRDFPLDLPGCNGHVATERSPYGVELEIRYPSCSVSALLDAAESARDGWQKLGPQGRVGVCLEILDRLEGGDMPSAAAFLKLHIEGARKIKVGIVG